MRDLNVKLGFVVALVSFGVATACGDDEGETPGTGGAPGSGGAATGGAKASGGTPGTGGTGAGGGPVATGGTASSTGGTASSTGGTASGTGGASSGGASSGGASSGGASSGGASSGGASSGGASSGGANGSGGSSGGTRCDVYCDLQGEKCGFGEAAPANYTARPACASYCVESLAPKTGTVGTASGDFLECRITHLNYIMSTSSAGDKTLHCGHSGKTPTSGCN